MNPFETVFLISIVAGLFGALTGLGGGTVMVPALTYLGVDIKIAIAASMVSVIATSCSSAAIYVREGIINLKLGMFLEMFTILGALAGAILTLFSGSTVLFVVFGVILVLSGITLALRERRRREPVAPVLDPFTQSLGLTCSYRDRAEMREIEYCPRHVREGGPLMFIAGMISGLMGIGAGAINVLIQDLVMGIPTKAATSTSNLIIGVTALAGSSIYLAAGLIDPSLVAPIILGVSLGAAIGTTILVRLTNREVRRYFVVIVVLIGLDMIRRGIA
jgi:Predicted permeases